MTNLTLDDIAKMAGVSRSTVSRVINDQPNVRQALRDRVRTIIDETGYQPNLAARSLVSQETKLLGLVIPRSVHGFFSDPYFPRLVEGISQACNQYGYSFSLSLFHNEDEERELLPKVTRKGFLDGIIVQATGLGENISPPISEWNIPFVFAGRPGSVPASNASYIDVDNVSGAYSAIVHLAQLGHHRIATVTGALDTAAGRDRLEGYQQAVRERQLETSQDLIEEGDFTEVSAYYATKRLLEHHPEAIFAASDTMAIGVLKALREVGFTVPNDIALVGFDDLPPATITEPQLTTIRQPIRRFGHKAVEILLDIIENGPTPPRRIMFDTELIIRGSCGSK